MPLIFLILLLLLPLSDIYLAFSWINESPLVALLYFAATTILGILLMKFAKIGFGEVTKLFHSGHVDPRLLAGFAGFWVAGALLFFPGYLSDIVAALLFILAWRAPSKQSPRSKKRFGSSHFGFAHSESPEYSENTENEYSDENEQTPIEAEVEIIDERRD